MYSYMNLVIVYIYIYILWVTNTNSRMGQNSFSNYSIIIYMVIIGMVNVPYENICITQTE